MGSREHHGSRRDSTGDDRLRERYEELRLLRETQPEREAAACKQAMQKNRAATDKLVASLREQLAAAQQGAPAASSANCDENAALAELRAENAELKRQLESASAAAPANHTALTALKAKLQFYELMSGLRCELTGDVAKCTVTCALSTEDDENEPPSRASRASMSSAAPKMRSAAFELHLNPADGEDGIDLEYVPTDLSGCEDGKLPEYLRESIIFERQDAPGFLQKLLSGVAAE